MPEIDNSGLPAAVEAKPSEVDRRLLRMMFLAFLVFVAGTWITLHFGMDWFAFPLAGVLFPGTYVLYSYITGEKHRDEKLVPVLTRWVDRIGPESLRLFAIVIAVVAVTVSTIDIRGLAEGTWITVPAIWGGEAKEVAVKDQPLRLHFLGPFRSIDISSTRHATTKLRTWPVWPRRVYAAELTPLPPPKPAAGVLLRLPPAAQRYLEDGEFVIGDERYPTNGVSGAILLGDHVVTPGRTWLFPGNVDESAQKTAIAAWSKPIFARVPREQPFRVAYLINDVEVAAADGVRLPPSGLTDIEMTYENPKP